MPFTKNLINYNLEGASRTKNSSQQFTTGIWVSGALKELNNARSRRKTTTNSHIASGNMANGKPAMLLKL